MFTISIFNRKKLVISLFTLVLSLALSVSALGVQDVACCDKEEPECPSRYSSFNPSEDVYSPGKTVELTLSGLTDKYLIEEIKIERLIGENEGVIYKEVIDQPIPGEQNQWSWTWNQISDQGEQVSNGRYFALVETDCCGTYRTDFKVLTQRRPVCSCNCCGSWSTSLETQCNSYDTGEEVNVSFSNCRDCDIAFQRLYITRSDRCCGDDEIVYSREFEEGFEPGRNWSWTWNQQNSNSNLVEPGRYTVTIETECCEKLKTSFTVNESRDCCRSSCCNSGFLFLGCCCNG